MKIVTAIGLYFVSIALYSFLYGCEWYADYYNYVSAGMGIFLGCCILSKHRIKEYERGAISIFIVYRVFCIVYLLVGNLSHKKGWMDQNIYFIITVGVSTFVAWFVYHLRKKHYEVF